jgi:hypothetical protein
MIIYLIAFAILLELTGLTIAAFIFLKRIDKQNTRNPQTISIKSSKITPEIIRDGVKAAIQELSYEEEKSKEFEKKRRGPEQIYGTVKDDGFVKYSGGNLVPYNLTRSEKSLLEMFYGNE